MNMKSIIVNKYISTAVFSLIFAITFGIVFLMPNKSFAGYNYYHDYRDRDIYINDFMNYRYDTSYQNTYYPVYPTYPSLYVSCYPSSTNVRTGESVTWTANVSGGNGYYSYNWYGTDSLYGSAQTLYKNYFSTGYKTASVTVTSNNQTITAQCNNTVNVYDNYYYNNNNNYYYNQTPVYVTCRPSYNTAQTGSTIVWTAYPTGGNGYYNYSWSGTDGLYGSNQSVSMAYSNAGIKSAQVTVTSGNNTITQSCSNYVDITSNYYPTYSTYNTYSTVTTNQNALDIGCYADPSTSVKTNQPITWIAEVQGGVAPYTYSWTGSDGLTGTESSIIKYYSASGSKSAVVTVRSADGKTGSRSCTNTVAVSNPVSSNIAKKANTTYVAVNSNSNNSEKLNTSSKNVSNQTAASFLSLQNVPWGSVAILVILVLFATVLYLIFNKKKI